MKNEMLAEILPEGRTRLGKLTKKHAETRVQFGGRYQLSISLSQTGCQLRNYNIEL